MSTNPPKDAAIAATQQSRTKQNNDVPPFKAILILLFVFALCMLALYFRQFNGPLGNQGDFGTFGDFFGGVLNPILGFATVGLLIWSLKVQIHELNATREEIARTAEETSLSRMSMQAQVDHLRQEANLNEIRNVITTQLDIIKNLSATEIFSIYNTRVTFDNVLNCDSSAMSYISQIKIKLNSTELNPVNMIARAIEIQLLQLASMSIAYSINSNSSISSSSYLAITYTWLSRYDIFNPSERIKRALERVLEKINPDELS
ncbi:hypothetical protein JYB88_10530 [Shewanella cyperi]|uniref:Uncharacterized protein n=1 Tax=Shewanella cyperi TaxID=2814292 RepID=A0A974XKK3_9GAMM|nr:hypothetical protein [Shewanella cyperi]QSX28721.1 hypothetical protein JYB88_10530 [Shewanella cyperi]